MEEIYCFAGNPLDRVSQRRQDAGWVRSLLEDPATRVLPLHGLKPPVRHSSATALDWQGIAPWRQLIDSGNTLILLGIRDGHAFFALDAGSTELPSDNGSIVMDARAAAPIIDGGEAAILAEARSLIDWHARHRFCAQCGTPSAVVSGGWVRHCPECKAHHFPRVDPVVIMLGVRGERCLLGRGHRRPGARFSCLAGFMEPGETLEEAVRREVLEESGIHIGRVRYLASQPWPFPSSLMLAFEARVSYQPLVRSPEHQEVRWFTRTEIREGLADGTMTIPPPISAGHHLIQSFLR